MITLTESAKDYLTTTTKKNGKKYAYLGVLGGGCSGFQYGFTLDQQKEDDYVFETNGAKLLIDPMSGVYFNGATIDYKDYPLNGSMFIINNPNAKSTCGCGSSAAF